jgi:hypothetical protein
MEITTQGAAKMTTTAYNNQTAPTQTVPVGARIVTTDTICILGGYNANTRDRGAPGKVISYATPEIQRNQVWPTESYRILLDGETCARTISRSDFVVVPDSL